VIRICTECGALLLEDADNCSFCDAPLAATGENLEPVAVEAGSTGLGASAQPASAGARSNEPEWRREVSRRLEDYRARRGHLRPNDSQSGLPFSRQSKIDEEEAARECQREAERQRQAERPRPRPASRQTERVEICIQPELDFSYAPDDRAHPQTALVPVANLTERRKAGLLDALFLGLTYIGFLGLFRSLGGQLMAERADAVVYLAAFFLFYALYFFLFTTFAEATPGMQLFCLTTVRLDGTVPDTRQLLWRSFGYVLAGATLMLGFLWALWDEDHFTWQDRISQTYITAAAPVVEPDALELPAGGRSFARK
jgi:uncharacterized RDD family membrane protein YckC